MISIQNGHISFLMPSQGEFKIAPILGLLPMVLLSYLLFFINYKRGRIVYFRLPCQEINLGWFVNDFR